MRNATILGGSLLAGALLAVPTLGAEHYVDTFPDVSDADRQGFVRVVNHSDRDGSVEIEAHDASGLLGATSLSIGARQTRHFNSDDLADGNARKGLPDGVGGGGGGDLWLRLTSDLDLEVLPYIRTPNDGFLTGMTASVPREGRTYHVPTFNPASNPNQLSSLRLVNRDSATTADVEIRGVDDAGEIAGPVSIALAPLHVATLTAADLEDGTNVDDGAFGDGTGKWRLVVTSANPVSVSSLMSTPTGHVTNLSGSNPQADYAPADQTAADERLEGHRIVTGDGGDHVDFLADRRFRERTDGTSYEGEWSYSRTSRNRARMTWEYDDGDRCESSVFFDSRTAGLAVYDCVEGDAGRRNWSLQVTLGGGDDYVAFSGLTVASNGSVTLRAGGITLSAGSAGCIRGIGNYNGRAYGAHWSAWQRNTGSGWTEVSGSRQDGGLCGYDLSSVDPGRYRLVGDMTLADERDLYKSANEVTK